MEASSSCFCHCICPRKLDRDQRQWKSPTNMQTMDKWEHSLHKSYLQLVQAAAWRCPSSNVDAQRWAGLYSWKSSDCVLRYIYRSIEMVKKISTYAVLRYSKYSHPHFFVVRNLHFLPWFIWFSVLLKCSCTPPPRGAAMGSWSQTWIRIDCGLRAETLKLPSGQARAGGWNTEDSPWICGFNDGNWELKSHDGTVEDSYPFL